MLPTTLNIIFSLLSITIIIKPTYFNINFFEPTEYFCNKYDTYKTIDYWIDLHEQLKLPKTWRKISDIGECNYEWKPCKIVINGNLAFQNEIFLINNVNKTNDVSIEQNLELVLTNINYKNELLKQKYLNKAVEVLIIYMFIIVLLTFVLMIITLVYILCYLYPNKNNKPNNYN